MKLTASALSRDQVVIEHEPGLSQEAQSLLLANVPKLYSHHLSIYLGAAHSLVIQSQGLEYIGSNASELTQYINEFMPQELEAQAFKESKGKFHLWPFWPLFDIFD